MRVRLGPPVDGERTIVSLRGDAPRLLARVEGVEDRDAAARLARATIEIAESALPRLGEDRFYVRDLVGLEVRVDDRAVGRVADVLDMPANDVIVVALDDGEQVMVPFVADAVASVEPGSGVLHVRAWVLERR